MIDFKKVQSRLIENLEVAAESIRKEEILDCPKSYQLTASQIKDKQDVQQLANELPKVGNYIYWLEVNLPDVLKNQLDWTKKNSSESKYKFARVNRGSASTYVYVGSCTKTKLSNRFKQHCGWGNDQTYSLQLSKWIGDADLSFTFSYIKIENDLVVQYIEDQLHRDLKPLFGKSGGNNKI
ncbi:hypothetical protein GCM10028819_48610 [Spirosoma humi]